MSRPCGVSGLPLTAPCLPRPGFLTPCPFSPSPSGLGPVQPKPSWRRTLAAAGTQSGAGREERGLGRQDGESGQSLTQRLPLLPRTPSSAWSPLHFPALSTGGLADLHAAPLPEGCAGEGGPCSGVVSAGSAEVETWKKHFQDGGCVPTPLQELSGRGGQSGFPISASRAVGASSGSRG